MAGTAGAYGSGVSIPLFTALLPMMHEPGLNFSRGIVLRRFLSSFDGENSMRVLTIFSGVAPSGVSEARALIDARMVPSRPRETGHPFSM